MSYLEILAIHEDGKVKPYDEVPNAFGGAMHIWMTLQEKYHTGSGFHFEALWSQIGTMETRDMWVLAGTFDQFIIPKAALPAYVKHLTAWVKDYPSQTLRDALPILRRMIADASIQGVCFNQTSVVDTWLVPNEDEEESRPYNITIDTGHKELTHAYIIRRRKEVI